MRSSGRSEAATGVSPRHCEPTVRAGRGKSPRQPSPPTTGLMSARELPEVNSRLVLPLATQSQEAARRGQGHLRAVSNVFKPEWVDLYGAGSSELSDARAEEFNLAKETFRNGRPEGWGQGTIEINSVEYSRQAPVHEWTKKPLGEGCRWERQTLDKLPFPVYAFFMP
ncbi:ANK1 [Symbiodinium sp. CCMP2592]|nr:ANK1 [Symbiodinium sp. CCMP2592]